MHKKSIIIFVAISLVALSLLLIFIAVILFQNSNNAEVSSNKRNINSFAECAKYYPIMESFPAQCRTPEGKLFVQDIDEEEPDSNEEPNQSFYGSSTFANCTQDSDCKATGCNAEICGSANPSAGEESISTCQLPPAGTLPQDQGYECSCVNTQCQWQ